jgi:tetratricopeptide (TPR) repeat protein
MLHVHDRSRQAKAWSRALDSGPVTGLAYSADSRLLAWGGADGRVRVCDAATGEETRVLGSHGSAVTGVAFHPEGQRVASAGRDDTFCIWDLDSGKVVARFGAPRREEDRRADANPKRDRPGDVTRIVYSPDGRRLAAANPRQPLEIWDPDTKRVVLIIDWESEGFTSAAWSADGERLAAAFGCRVKVWDATEQSLEQRRRATEGDALAWHRSELARARHRWDWFAANYHLGKLIQAQPVNASLYADRATFRACLAIVRRSRLEDAAADMDRVVDLTRKNPDPDPQMWHLQGLLALATGNRDRYRTVCRDMLAHFGQTQKFHDAWIVARTCTLAPDAVADLGLPVKLADRALARQRANPTYLKTVGVALYRAGRFDEARQRLTESVNRRKLNGEVWDWLYLAMTNHQLDQREEARRWLDRAVQAIDHTDVDRPLPGTVRLTGWAELLELNLLRQEASALLQGAKR